jgi:hypothetical protein
MHEAFFVVLMSLSRTEGGAYSLADKILTDQTTNNTVLTKKTISKIDKKDHMRRGSKPTK